MARWIVRLSLGMALASAGWIAARAQASDPDFVIEVTAPLGETTVRCVRGCTLAWVQQGLNPNATPTDSYHMDCRGQAPFCPSGQIGGWISK